MQREFKSKKLDEAIEDSKRGTKYKLTHRKTNAINLSTVLPTASTARYFI